MPTPQRRAIQHHDDAMEAFLSGDLLNPQPHHHTQTYQWDTDTGPQYSAECDTCDWTTIRLPDQDRVQVLAEQHRRNPHA